MAKEVVGLATELVYLYSAFDGLSSKSQDTQYESKAKDGGAKPGLGMLDTLKNAAGAAQSLYRVGKMFY